MGRSKKRSGKTPRQSRIMDFALDYKLHILLVALIALFIALYADFSFLEKKTLTVELADQCGQLPSGLGVEHTIIDAEACDTQCFAICESQGFSDYKPVFTNATEAEGCNKCSCECS